MPATRERTGPQRLLQPNGTVVDCCPTCGRPSPQAQYKLTDGDATLAWAIGFVASCIVMGFGASWWHGIAILLIGAAGGAVALKWSGEKKLEAMKRDG
jgi:hypothetical protein